jgi:hypothetical protein
MPKLPVYELPEEIFDLLQQANEPVCDSSLELEYETMPKLPELPSECFSEPSTDGNISEDDSRITGRVT